MTQFSIRITVIIAKGLGVLYLTLGLNYERGRLRIKTLEENEVTRQKLERKIFFLR